MTSPWALGIGMLVSLTAEASNTPQAGFSSLAREHLAQLTTAHSPTFQRDLSLNFNVGDRFLNANFDNLQARLNFDQSDDNSAEDFLPLRAEMKQVASSLSPVVNRAAKSASVNPVPESLSRRGLDIRNASVMVRPLSARDERVLPTTIIKGKSRDATIDGFQIFEQDDDDETSSEALVFASSSQSPTAAAAGSTGSGITTSMGDGSTPTVSRAIVLSSATPAPFDEMPMEISAAPVSRVRIPAWSDDITQPNYSSMINTANWESEKRCLAEAVYYEARSEPPEGQAAVAQVVLNRVGSGLYPKTICGVVYQNRHRHLACQFTFACEGKALRVTEPGPWAQAQKIADEVLEGKTYLSEVGGSTHYHADYVRPYWAKKLKRMDMIGRHIFYKLKPGQT